jgi:hypothetical protein
MEKPDMTVAVSPKKAYGRDMLNPENETARLFCELLDAKNLTVEQCQIIKRLGFKIVPVAPGLEGLTD